MKNWFRTRALWLAPAHGGAAPAAAMAADSSRGGSISRGVTTLWFKSNVHTDGVHLHHLMGGGGRQNLRMRFKLERGRCEQLVRVRPGQALRDLLADNGAPAYGAPGASRLCAKPWRDPRTAGLADGLCHDDMRGKSSLQGSLQGSLQEHPSPRGLIFNNG